MDGRIIYHGSTPVNPGAPCPKLSYCGTSVTGYGSTRDYYGPQYVLPEAQQPLATDMYNTNGYWRCWPYGQSIRSNHANGENIVYVDGHGEWKNANQVQKRFNDYYTPVYW